MSELRGAALLAVGGLALAIAAVVLSGAGGAAVGLALFAAALVLEVAALRVASRRRGRPAPAAD